MRFWLLLRVVFSLILRVSNAKTGPSGRLLSQLILLQPRSMCRGRFPWHNHQARQAPIGSSKVPLQGLRLKLHGDQGHSVLPEAQPEETILDALSQIAEGSRISSVSRTKGVKTDTILSWVREAGEHAEEVEEFLLGKHQVQRAQIDGLWAYVQNKGSKKTIEKPKPAAPSGARP